MFLDKLTVRMVVCKLRQEHADLAKSKSDRKLTKQICRVVLDQFDKHISKNVGTPGIQ